MGRHGGCAGTLGGGAGTRHSPVRVSPMFWPTPAGVMHVINVGVPAERWQAEKESDAPAGAAATREIVASASPKLEPTILTVVPPPLSSAVMSPDTAVIDPKTGAA